ATLAVTSGGAAIDPALVTLLEHMIKVDASDLYLNNEVAPTFRCDGVGLAGKVPATSEMLDRMADSLMTAAQRDEFKKNLEMNLAVAVGGNRFRVNVFRQKGATGMVVRLVKTKIATLADLNHPKTLADVMQSKRGLVLLVGGTGSGKSTTLAAMIDHRNTTATGHIVTIEDPVEFIHPHKKCVVTQREVGFDTRSYKQALANTLRQAPDVILIGEIRDAETMEAALAFAETGHLCLSTLHSNNADQAIERILNFFPSERQPEILSQLSLNLRAIVAQRLLPAIGGGRAAALEIMLDTPRVKDLIRRHEIHVLKDAMEQSAVDGCQTFDAALFTLCTSGRITEDEALRSSDSPNNLRLRLERHRGSAGAPAGHALRLVGEQPQQRHQPQPAQTNEVSGVHRAAQFAPAVIGRAR
ncbi:MAG: twitching motility protein PilU, partial [Myxococcales bacterium]|nr:twitching motility protein PilU [Myxococcales bacterium]